MEIYTNADYAGSVVDRRPTFGYCMFLGGNLVTWKRKKQNVVVQSSVEVEFRAMAQGIYEGLYMKIILDDLKVKYEGPIKLFYDNNLTISIAHNPVQHDRKKHIEIDKHIIKEKLDNELIVTTHVPTGLQVVDVFTKGLPTTRFQELNVIIANNLHQEQEDKLLQVLRQHRKAIGWKLSDLQGINPSICMHIILMEEEAKPIRKQQRRMNPTIIDVVKKEVTKLLAAGIIYPFSDSQWVIPVQVVPKKSGMTVMKNQHDELVPMRIQNRWRVCIDYRRLNWATRKDHFPLPFIDQVLEKLLGKSHYCFLDGFSGYMQIHIAHED
ncbi:Copia protein, partial [Mucuna pruriens]